MGTQGLSGRTVFGGRGEGRPFGRIVSLGVYLAIMPLVAGCSSSSVPWFGSSNSQTAVPPNASVAAAGQPQYAAAPGQPGYAQQTQPGTAQPATYAAAAAPPAQAPASEQGATVGSFKSSYVNFLRAFRDPPEPDPSASPGYPSQRPDPSGAGYPQQSLMGSSNSANPPQQRAYVPHPPSTYSPSGQPYTPPAQPAYAPPPAQQNYAAPSAQPAYAPRPGQQSYAAPPAQQAYSAPAAAAAPAAQSDYSELITLSQAVARRCIPRLDRDANRAAPTEHLHGIGAALYAAARSRGCGVGAAGKCKSYRTRCPIPSNRCSTSSQANKIFCRQTGALLITF